MSEVFDFRVLVAAQKALLGEVQPNLRMASVDVDGNKVRFELYFDGELSEDDLEAIGFIDTEMIAFLGEELQIDTIAIRLDYPEPVPKTGTWVYFRKE